MNSAHQGIRECAILSALPESEIDHLANVSLLRNFKKHTIILSAGDLTDSVYVIVDGRVRVYRDNEEGKQITLNTLNPGLMFGELAAMAGVPRVATVESIESTHCLIITKAEFINLLERNASLAITLANRFARLVHLMSDHMADIALLDVYGRLTNFLERSATIINGKQVVEGFTHQELANNIGSSREVISRMLSGLKRGGYIITEKDSRQIIIEKKLPPGW